MKTQQAFLIHDGLEGLRIYTVVSLQSENSDMKYGFYRSSGNNSKYFETWFPLVDKQHMHIVKPSDIWGYHFENCYPNTFISFISDSMQSNRLKFENGYEELFDRFGSFECMCLSYLLGGGYWAHDDSKVLREYLETHYPSQLKSLKASIEHYDSFKNPTGESVIGRDLYRRYQTDYAVKNVNYQLSLYEYPEIDATTLNPVANDMLMVMHEEETFPNDNLLKLIKTICESDWRQYVRGGSKQPAGNIEIRKILNSGLPLNETLKQISDVAEYKHSTYFQWAHRFFRGRDNKTNEFYNILRMIKAEDPATIEDVAKQLDLFKSSAFALVESSSVVFT